MHFVFHLLDRFLEEGCVRNTGTIVRIWQKNVKGDLNSDQRRHYEVGHVLIHGRAHPYEVVRVFAVVRWKHGGPFVLQFLLSRHDQNGSERLLQLEHAREVVFRGKVHSPVGGWWSGQRSGYSHLIYTHSADVSSQILS